MNTRIMIGLTFMTAISVAQADIFSEDFQSYDNGSVLAGQGGWTATGTGDGHTVLVGTPRAGDRAMRVSDVSTVTAGPLYAQNLFGATNTAQTTITYEFKGDSYSTGIARSAFQLLGRTAGGGLAAGVVIDMQSADGDLETWNNEDGTFVWNSQGVSLATEEWYSFQITFDDLTGAGMDTYDLLITDSSDTVVLNATDLLFRNDLVSFEMVRFGQMGGAAALTGTTFFVDNINVIPEPATLGLVSTVSIGILFLRRRRML